MTSSSPSQCPFCFSRTAPRLVSNYPDPVGTFSVLCHMNFGGCGARGGHRSTEEEARKVWDVRYDRNI